MSVLEKEMISRTYAVPPEEQCMGSGLLTLVSPEVLDARPDHGVTHDGRLLLSISIH